MYEYCRIGCSPSGVVSVDAAKPFVCCSRMLIDISSNAYLSHCVLPCLRNQSYRLLTSFGVAFIPFLRKSSAACLGVKYDHQYKYIKSVRGPFSFSALVAANILVLLLLLYQMVLGVICPLLFVYMAYFSFFVNYFYSGVLGNTCI